MKKSMIAQKKLKLNILGYILYMFKQVVSSPKPPPPSHNKCAFGTSQNLWMQSTFVFKSTSFN